MKKLIAVTAIIMAATNAFGQWECRSKLASSLRPIGTSNFSWGNELTTSSGYLTDNFIHNTMIFGGLDYTNNRHTFFVEGGFKFWSLTEYNAIMPEDTVKFSSSTQRLGLREAFYQYSGNNSKLMVGLHSATLKDHYLLNERILGVNYNIDLGKFNVAVTGGSVTRDFARNGSFCSVRYLYDIFDGRPLPELGYTFGKTNMVSTTLVYNPHKATTNQSVSGDEFAADDFSTEPQTEVTNRYISLESVGAVAYHEIFDLPNTIDASLFGVFSSIKLWGGLIFEPEVLYQANKDNRALIYSLALSKDFILNNNHKINFEGKYLGLSSIDSMAVPRNSFSNLFIGEVIRLDAIDIPLFQLSCKYTIPSIKGHLKIQTVANTLNKSPRDEYRNEFRETDIEIGKTFFKKMLINAQFGLIESNLLDNKKYLARAEIRYNF